MKYLILGLVLSGCTISITRPKPGIEVYAAKEFVWFGGETSNVAVDVFFTQEKCERGLDVLYAEYQNAGTEYTLGNGLVYKCVKAILVEE